MPVIFTIFVLTTKSLRLMADDSQEIFSGYKQTTQVKVWCVEQMISLGSPIPLWEPIRGSLTHKQHPVGRPCWGGWPSLGLYGTYRTRTELLEMEQPTVEGLPSEQKRLLPRSQIQLKWAQNAVFTPLTLSAIWRSLRSFGMLYQFRKEGLDGFSKMGLHFIAL